MQTFKLIHSTMFILQKEVQSHFKPSLVAIWNKFKMPTNIAGTFKQIFRFFPNIWFLCCLKSTFKTDRTHRETIPRSIMCLELVLSTNYHEQIVAKHMDYYWLDSKCGILQVFSLSKLDFPRMIIILCFQLYMFYSHCQPFNHF